MAKGFASELLAKKLKADYAIFREDTEEFLASCVSRNDCFLNGWHLHPEKALLLTKAEAQSLVDEIGKTSVIVCITKVNSQYVVEEI
jgi:hypothetical protein